MEIKTKRFGTIRIEEDKIILMPKGMLGFPENRRFVILRHRENSPFFWYQAVDDPALAFVIVDPLLFKPDYRRDLEHALREMEWATEDSGMETEGLETYVVVNIPPGEPHKMTANLIGPILVNPRSRQAVQVVLADVSCSHKHPLIEPVPSTGSN